MLAVFRPSIALLFILHDFTAYQPIGNHLGRVDGARHARPHGFYYPANSVIQR